MIGMRINRPWKVRRWWPVFTAMPRMIKWLEQHPQAGLLHYEQALGSPLSPMLVQYWRLDRRYRGQAHRRANH